MLSVFGPSLSFESMLLHCNFLSGMLKSSRSISSIPPMSTSSFFFSSIFFSQDCYESKYPRQHPLDVQTHPTTPRTSTLAASEAIGYLSAPTIGERRSRPPSNHRKGWPSDGHWGCPPKLSDGGGRLSHPPKAIYSCHPPEAIHLGPSACTECSL